MPAPYSEHEFKDALEMIRKIMDSTHPKATPGEKLVRIGWVIGTLPIKLRDAVLKEIQNRVVVGWADGKKPTDF